MRVVAIFLTVAALASMAVSLASHEQHVDTGWTMYTPLSNDLPATQGARIYEYPDKLATSTYNEYDRMPWDDARLWLGLAIGFAISAAALGVALARHRPRH